MPKASFLFIGGSCHGEWFAVENSLEFVRIKAPLADLKSLSKEEAKAWRNLGFEPTSFEVYERNNTPDKTIFILQYTVTSLIKDGFTPVMLMEPGVKEVTRCSEAPVLVNMYKGKKRAKKKTNS
jgi:hypothetical protein